MKTVIIVIIIFFTCLSVGRANTQTRSGSEHGFFTVAKRSVIVARVIDLIDQEPKSASTTREYVAVLEPLATLAGGLDPSACGKLEATVFIGPPDGQYIPVHIHPKKGAIVLVLLIGNDAVEPDKAMFMPGDCAPLQEMDGLGDKRIVETLDRIRDARKHEEPDLNAQPPASNTKDH